MSRFFPVFVIQRFERSACPERREAKSKESERLERFERVLGIDYRFNDWNVWNYWNQGGGDGLRPSGTIGTAAAPRNDDSPDYRVLWPELL